MSWNTMFNTAVCVIFLIKLRWPKNKSLKDPCFENQRTFTKKAREPLKSLRFQKFALVNVSES